MGLYTRLTRDWLERRFGRRSPAGVYHAHMPIYGVGAPDCEPGHVGRLARLLRIVRALDGLRAATLLDVGGAEGYLCHLARTMFDLRTVSCDLSVAACQRARELFALPTAAVDCSRLPFADRSFDIVVCSEVLEHVENPLATVLELQRVARSAVVLTTEELHHDKARIDDYLFRRPGWPHMERNLFHPDDLAACFPGAALGPQCDAVPPASNLGRDAARAWLLANTTTDACAPGRPGVVAIDIRDPAVVIARRHGDAELLDRLLAATVAPGAVAAAQRDVDPWLLALLRDPLAHGPLRAVDGTLVAADGRRYRIEGGVPDLVPADAPDPTRAELELRLQTLPGPRAAALLALHDRLFLPERSSQDVFDFRRRADRRGFWPNEQLVPRAGGEGFSWRATGGDPWLLTPCLQRPVRELELELRVHNPTLPVAAGDGQVFWMGPGDQTLGEDRSVHFRVPNDGRVHRHRIVLHGHPRLPAVVHWLRIDPIDGPCDVDLLGLRLG